MDTAPYCASPNAPETKSFRIFDCFDATPANGVFLGLHNEAAVTSATVQNMSKSAMKATLPIKSQVGSGILDDI